MLWWDERSLHAKAPLHNDGDEQSVSQSAPQPTVPLPPPVDASDIVQLRYDGTPAWAALVPNAVLRGERGLSTHIQQVQGLYSGCRRHKSCVLGLEFTDSRGRIRRVRDLFLRLLATPSSTHRSVWLRNRSATSQRCRYVLSSPKPSSRYLAWHADMTSAPQRCSFRGMWRPCRHT